MGKRILISRTCLIAGVVAMIAGAIDPLEGAPLILLGVAVSTLGATLAKARCRVLLYWALALVTLGVGAMFVLSALGGIGGKGHLSFWWGAFILPYPAGWIAGLVGAVAAIRESSHHAHVGPAAPSSVSRPSR